MGQIVNVVERPSTRPGIVRFDTNRALSGMGHDRYVAGQVIDDDRPVDELARRILARGGVVSVHVNGGMITVDLEKGHSADGIADIIRGLYTFYPDPGEELDARDPRAAVAARNEQLQADFEAAEAAAAAKAAEEAEVTGEPEPPADETPATETETGGHGEVVADTTEAPKEADADAALDPDAAQAGADAVAAEAADVAEEPSPAE
jgi:hypothetical protein